MIKFFLKTVLIGFAAASLVVLPGADTVRANTDPSTIEGRWLTGKRKVAVSIFPCGDAYCGRIDWLAKPRYRGGELKIDRENPDPALRERPWCGIDIISGLRRKKSGVWSSGQVYNPKDGNTYDLEIKEKGESLKVRAYLGVKLLGKTEVWVRAPADVPGCEEVS
ncbi:MAG: DUF2147 domain-containing protein [Pseudomonadota bacterium]